MKKNNLFIFGIFLFAISSASISGKLYKWVDNNGNISFSDKVPPKYSRKEHSQLNESGRVIVVKDAAKTPKQIELLKKINALQHVQQKLLDEQLAHDSALLKTFQSAADIDTLAASKSDMVKSHIAIASGQSDTLKKQLLLHQKVAADFERKGKKIPQKTLDNIESSQTQFDKNQREISSFELQEIQLGEQLIKDKERFITLSTQSTEKPSVHQETIPSLVLGKLPCTKNNCDVLWKKAQSFVIQQGNVIIYTSSKLVLSKTPKLGKDRGLSLTMLTKDEQNQIMLDIRCADSAAGKTTCKSTKNDQIVQKFQQLSL